MAKLGTIATFGFAAAMTATSASAQEGFTDLETTPGFNDKVEQIVQTACPDPTPSAKTFSEILEYKACIDGAGLGMNKIAVEVSNYITEHRLEPAMIISAIPNHKALVQCNTTLQNSYIPDEDFNATIDNLNAYGNARIEAVRLCIDRVATVQDNTGYWYNQAAQNAVITQLNCLLTPDTCERPVLKRPDSGPTADFI